MVWADIDAETVVAGERSVVEATALSFVVGHDPGEGDTKGVVNAVRQVRRKIWALLATASFWRQLSMISRRFRPSSSTPAESDSEADVREAVVNFSIKTVKAGWFWVVRVALSDRKDGRRKSTLAAFGAVVKT